MQELIRMKKIIRTTILLVALTLTILTPAATLSSTVDSASTPPVTEDIFEGIFSPQEVTAVPDEAFDVSFSISPTIDAPNTAIRLIMPADLIKLVEGDQEWTGDVEKGETVTLHLSFATDGEVEANIRADVEASPSGTEYSSSYYLHVTTAVAEFDGEHGGSTRPVNLEADMPDPSNPESSRMVLNVEDQPTDPGNFRIYGRWWYLNENGGWSVGRYMLVEIWDSDSTSADDKLASGWTDANGYYDITAPNDDGFGAATADPYVRFIAMGRYDWVTTTSGGSTYWWRYPNSGTIQDNVPDGWTHNAGNLAPGSSHEALQAGDAVWQEADWIFARVSWERGPGNRVTIRWPREDWPHCHGDYIDMPAKSTASWDHVTVHHEYAHAVQWTLYGNSWPEGCLFGTHWVYMEDVMPDAWCEGWAEFMQCAVDNDPTNLGGATVNIETNTWFNYQDTGDMDGQYIEGSVASILWDIHDPVNTATDDDHMYWGFEEIFTVVRYGDAGADDNPNSILDFWTDWISRWPSVSSSAGPLSTIYWHYGINRDYYNPYGGSVIINGGAAYTTSTSVSIALFCKDWGSGMYAVRLRTSASWSGWYAYGTSAGWTLPPGDGYKYIYVQYMDRVGRLSPQYSDYIYLDTTPPSASIVINSGNPTYTTSTSVTLYLTYSDATSLVKEVRYRNDGGVWTAWMAPTSTKAWTLPTGDGTKTVYYQVRDYAGWICPTKSDTIILDTVNPTGSIVISGGAATTTTTAVTLTLTYSDATSGVDAVRYGNYGEYWTAWEAPSPTRAWTLSSGLGTKRVYYQLRDNAGRYSLQYYDEIDLITALKDTEITFTLSPNPANPGDTVLLSGTLMDEYDDPVYPADVVVEYSTDGSTWYYGWTLSTNTAGEFSTSFTAPGVDTYYVRASYAGSASYNPSSHTEKFIVQTPGPVETQLFFNFDPNPVTVGTSVELEGILVDVNSNPISSASVRVEYSTNDGTTWNYFTTLTTNTYGEFSIVFTAPSVGTYLVIVRYAGDATYNPSRSTTYLGILSAPPAVSTESSIYFNFSPNPVKSGTSVQLKGILIQLGDPIAGASVKVEYSTNNGASWNPFTTLTTNAYGIFSTTFTAPGPGTYLVRVTSGSFSVTTYLKVTS